MVKDDECLLLYGVCSGASVGVMVMYGIGLSMLLEDEDVMEMLKQNLELEYFFR